MERSHGRRGGVFGVKREGFIAECCAHHRNAQRAIVIPGDDADSDVGCVIGDDRIAAAEERMFARRRVLI